MRQAKKSGKIILAFVLLALSIIRLSSAQVCDDADIPKMLLPKMFEVDEGTGLRYSINLSNDITDAVFSLIPINSSIIDISITDDGDIFLNDTGKKEGDSSYYVIATRPNGCYEMKKVVFKVFARPKITEYIPVLDSFRINETQSVVFTIEAEVSSFSSEAGLSYSWYKDDVLVSEGPKTYIMRTNYSDSGNHKVAAVIEDARGLNTTKEWGVRVGNRNRKPVMRKYFPDLVITEQMDDPVFNLYNYFYDPDSDTMMFEAYRVDGDDPEIFMNSSRVFSTKIGDGGALFIVPIAQIYVRQYFRIKAIDSFGDYIYSPSFAVRLATDEDMINHTEIFQPAERCEPRIDCTDWSECLPTGIMVRECRDIYDCDGTNTTILESKECEYNATCDDGILNQGEEGVDCGGPCEPCPTCDDGILNQGEEDIDCGGPCNPCPSCYDYLKNQDETDIDCGGSCQACMPGKACKRHADCDSFICSSNLCQEASCNDFRQNQGEKGIDCGGPCEPCPTCNDGILNQDEEDIDCGGPCSPCITCYDGIKNQGELFADCGGPCEPCGIITYLLRAKTYILLLVPAFVIFMSVAIVRKNYNKDRIKFQMDLAKTFGFISIDIPGNAGSSFISTINKLHTVKQELYNLEDKKKILQDYNDAVLGLMKDLFEIEESVSKGMLKDSIKKKTMNPFVINLFIELYDYVKHISADSPLFKIEMMGRIDYTISVLNDMKQVLGC